MTDRLDDAFAGFRVETTMQIAAPGPAHVRTVVRRRRRTAVILAGVAALALVAVPAAVFAAMNRDTPPPPGTRVTTPAAPPPTTAPPSPTASRTPPAPDGRIGRAELLAARLDLPRWQAGAGCARNDVRLVEAPARKGTVWLSTLAYGDVDRDGAEETLIVVRCMGNSVGFGVEQAVAVDRDPDGRIVAIGRVTATDTDVRWLRELDARPDGSVRIRVADVLPFDDQPESLAQYQWRTYAMVDGGFRQTGGPTSFGANPRVVDLSITASDLRFSADAGDRRGTVTVTVRNAGPRDARGVNVTLEYGDVNLRTTGAGWNRCAEVHTGSGAVSVPASWHSCLLAVVPAGATRTLVLDLSAEAGLSIGSGGSPAEARVHHEADSSLPLPDLNPADNQDPFHLRTP
jgi:hypothetical protein